MQFLHIHEKVGTSSRDYSYSTLLIPAQYRLQFKTLCKMHGSRRKLARWLLGHRLADLHQHLDQWITTNPRKWKTQYQTNGLDLQKYNFIPDPEVWESYRQTALGLGISICYLFVLLLEIEIFGLPAPAKPASKFKKFVNSCVHRFRVWVSFGISGRLGRKIRRDGKWMQRRTRQIRQ